MSNQVPHSCRKRQEFWVAFLLVLLVVSGCASPGVKRAGDGRPQKFDDSGRWYWILDDCRPVIAEYGDDGKEEKRKHLLRLDYRGDGDSVKICVRSDQPIGLSYPCAELIPLNRKHHCIEITGFDDPDNLTVKIDGDKKSPGLKGVGVATPDLKTRVYFTDQKEEDDQGDGGESKPRCKCKPIPDGVLIVQNLGVVTALQVYAAASEKRPPDAVATSNCNAVVTPPPPDDPPDVGAATTAPAIGLDRGKPCVQNKVILFDYVLRKPDENKRIIEVSLLSDVPLHFGSEEIPVEPGIRYLLEFDVTTLFETLSGTIRTESCKESKEDLGGMGKLGSYDDDYPDEVALAVVPDQTNPERARLYIEYKGAGYGCVFERCR